jgi:hypothetical protein
MVGTVRGTEQIEIEIRTVIEIGTGRETVGDLDLQRIGNDGARVTGTTTGGPQQRPHARQILERTLHRIRKENQFRSRSV